MTLRRMPHLFLISSSLTKLRLIILGRLRIEFKTQDWKIKHVDVKIAYLNAMLKETIYMKLP